MTGVSILGRGFSMPQIMSVSGHRSTSSLAVYQLVSYREKQAMGNQVHGWHGQQALLQDPDKQWQLELFVYI